MDAGERARGVLLGLVAGNVLGVGVEGWPGSRIRQRYPDGVREIDAAERDRPWDDDVAQAIILAEAIVERGELSLDDLGGRFLRWYREGARGIGAQTSQVMRELAGGTPPTDAARLVWERSGGKAAGNGAVMRCAPLAIRWRHEVELLVDQSRVSARITHEDPRCQW
ncbi:MAG: ADP-ribosylglycohydrolase family protein, partial [Actinomycetota bacterium]